jgi:membrane protein implicated in regulation of membrane protease activity
MPEELKAMPQLIFFALVALVVYYGYRSFVREAQRVSARVRRQEKQARNGAIGTLVKDPVTGEYRLSKD